MFSRLYYSRVTPVATGNLIRAIVSVVMLAQTAFVSLDAIIRALWRRFVSHKKTARMGNRRTGVMLRSGRVRL